MIKHIDRGYSYPVHVHRYESVTEWYRESERNTGRDRYNDEFYGHADPRAAVAYCEKNIGEHHMRHARELVDQIDASFRDRERVTWQPSPYGAYAVVPEYLAGEPECMRMQNAEPDDNAPIRYWIEAVVSAGTGLHELERRATAIAALVMRSVEERPVELNVMIAAHPGRSDGYLAVIPVQTHPIDLHSTIATLATREFCRCMAFNNARAATGGSGSSMHWLYGNPTAGGVSDSRERQFRRVLDIAPQDVVIQGGYLPDAYIFRSDPVQWVHNQLAKQRTVEE